MIPDFLWYLILRQLHTYGMLNTIINSSNNLCIVCFLDIYQSSITLICILRYHISSTNTNISPHLFTIKDICHYMTLIRIIIYIQPHTHRLKQINSFSSYNQQTKKARMQEKRKNKIPNCKNWVNIFSKLYDHSKKIT
jgi:hypothetical protein